MCWLNIAKTYIFVAYMIRVCVKIFHYFILLITGIALIGVNVRILHCCHSEDSIVEVRMMPDEEETPCSEDCCGTKQCHTHSQHTFYKITDFLRVEPVFYFLYGACILPFVEEYVPLILGVSTQCAKLEDVELHLEPPSCAFLCTYLC